MKPFWIHPDASSEFEEAVVFYNDRRSGLGDELRHALEAGIASIRENPLMNSIYEGTECREFADIRFHYRIIYLDDPAMISILAVSHPRRRPGYWKNRLDDLGILKDQS